MKKRTKIIIVLLIIASPILFWIASIIKCEVLTSQHNEFKYLYKQTNMLGESEYFKVLDYNDKSATVYYVGINRAYGNILKFIKKNGKWVLDSWNTIWSRTGSADEFMWPYIR